MQLIARVDGFDCMVQSPPSTSVGVNDRGEITGAANQGDGAKCRPC
jgi:hypothetical protein